MNPDKPTQTVTDQDTEQMKENKFVLPDQNSNDDRLSQDAIDAILAMLQK